MLDSITTTDETAKALGTFSRAYSDALAQYMDQMGGANRFGAYYQQSKKLIVLRGRDGYLVLFAEGKSAGRKGPAPFLQGELNILDCSGWDLNTICQALSFHFIRIIKRAIGDQFTLPTPLPEVLDLTETIGPQFTILSETLLGDLEQARGVAISPIWNVEQGVVRGVRPARVILWSPLVSGRRQFTFTHADFWWKPEDLSLDIEHAAQLAELDATSLRFLADTGALGGPTSVFSDTNSTASELITQRCDELQRLLETNGGEEETIHQWLLLPGNDIFLDAHAEEIMSKVAFGGHVSDFVIRRSNGTYSLCEIERATARLFIKNGEPSKDLNHAVQQVLDWKRYVRDNVHTVANEQGLKGIYEPDGFVIIGRNPSDQSSASRWRDIKNRGRDGVSVYTFDDIIERTRGLARNLKRFVQMG